MKSIEGYIRAFVAALFMIGGLLYFGMNVMVYSYADGITRQQREWENPRDPLASRKLKISEHRAEDGKRFKPGYVEMAKFDDIDAGRTVYFSAYVPLEDLLNAGEQRPSPELLQVFAKSRAILYAQKECERVMQSVARECAVNHAEGRAEDGIVSISGYLRFVQRDDLGAIDENAAWVFSNVNDNLTEGSGRPTSLSSGETGRAALYRKAAQKCAEIKRREGNCAITAMRVSMRKAYKGGYELDASAEYSFLIRQPA